MPLTPVDTKQCQSEITTYNPWVMGGSVRQTERCTNAAEYIATEKEPGADGETGAMSLCSKCREVLIKQFTKNNQPLPVFARIG